MVVTPGVMPFQQGGAQSGSLRITSIQGEGVGVAVGAGGVAVWQAESSPVSRKMIVIDKMMRPGVCDVMSAPFVSPAGRLDHLIVDSAVRFVK